MKKIIVMVCCALVAACSLQVKHRGYVFPSDLDAQIATVKTTKQLQNLVGDPLAKTIYGDEVWLYYSADEHYRGPFKHTYTDKTVLLAWVKNGRVTKTQILHDADLPDVVIDSGETEVPAAVRLNAFEELFNNIGRFSPAGLGQ